MQEHAWEQLLRRIPANYHNGLILSTIAGADLVVQTILRLDEAFLIIRGRTSGSTDGGKTIVIPIKQINYISFDGRLTDAEVEAVFGNKGADFASAAAPPPLEEDDAVDDFDIPPSDTSHAPTPSGQPSDSAKQSKSILLAKLRARIAESSKSGGS